MADEKEKSEAEPETLQYKKEAVLLANSYTQMLREREFLKRRLAGSWIYTKEMAIADLNNISASYDGERVQSSNISNPTEQIAMKITDKYLAQKQAELDATKVECIKDLEYLEWKIEVVETVWHERAIGMQRSVFQLLFYQHKTFKEAGDILFRKKNCKMYNCNIIAIKEKIWGLFEKELCFRYQDSEEQRYVKMLVAESQRVSREGKDGDSAQM